MSVHGKKYEINFKDMKQIGKFDSLQRHRNVQRVLSSAAPTAAAGTAFRWEWRSDTGWQGYAPAVSAVIEAQFLANKSQGMIDINSRPYNIDFARLVQVGRFDKMKRERGVRRVPVGSAGPKKWQWRSDTGWVDMNPATSALLEQAHSTGLASASYDAAGRQYNVDFDRKVQTRTDNPSLQRGVRRG